MKHITLCADDFALHPAVDAAVVALAQAAPLVASAASGPALEPDRRPRRRLRA